MNKGGLDCYLLCQVNTTSQLLKLRASSDGKNTVRFSVKVPKVKRIYRKFSFHKLHKYCCHEFYGISKY